MRRVKLPARIRSGHSPMKVHNREVIKAALAGYTEKTIKPMLAKALGEVGRDIADLVDEKFMPCPPYAMGGDKDFPVWFADMRDATGVGVYCDGVLSSYTPTVKFIAPQTDAGFENIIGYENLEKALQAGLSKYGKDLWIVLYSAVPYAERINAMGSPRGRGKDYFNKFEEWMLEAVKSKIPMVIPVGFSYE
jgi:hypothetical protein